MATGLLSVQVACTLCAASVLFGENATAMYWVKTFRRFQVAWTCFSNAAYWKIFTCGKLASDQLHCTCLAGIKVFCRQLCLATLMIMPHFLLVVD